LEFEDVLRFINLFCSGIAAGILVVVMTALMPSVMTFPDTFVVRFKAKFDPLVDRINPPFVLFSMITAVLILIVADLSTVGKIFTIVGILGSIGVAVTSMTVNMRINRTMATWDADAPPPEFRPLITRWIGVHRIRTLSGVLAFVCYIVAALSAIA
jgi:uncharacterized membrane protein